MPTAFSTLLAGVRATPGSTASIEVPADWGQGRSTFGGLVVALALERMRLQVEPDRRPRSLLIAFIGPVAPGPIEIRVEVLREGRSASQLEARVIQAGQTCCSVTAAFAGDRESVLAVEGRAAPDFRGPEGVPALPYIEGLTPAFTQHVELRWALGAGPYARTSDKQQGGWCRFRESGPADESHVLALVDAWPAPILQQLRTPAMASSMSWMIEFPARDEAATCDGWWAFHADTDRAAGGWVHAHAALWSPSGKLVALSRQTVAVFG
ncbi:acyl-CoA thioesterase [Nannocystaceae bacterium ST9]